MSVIDRVRPGAHRTRLLHDRRLSVLVTAGLFVLMFGFGAFRYQAYGFLDGQVFMNLFIDNGYLLVAAIGATFVILTGGIDLSVGSLIGFTTMLTAWLVEKQGMPLLLVAPIALGVGALGGYLMGYVIHHFEIEPFIVTLAGLFFFRGLCLVISKESISITDPTVDRLAQTHVPLPGGSFLSIAAVVSSLWIAPSAATSPTLASNV